MKVMLTYQSFRNHLRSGGTFGGMTLSPDLSSSCVQSYQLCKLLCVFGQKSPHTRLLSGGTDSSQPSQTLRITHS